MSAPAIAQEPTPPPKSTPVTSQPPATTPTSEALAQAKKDNRRVEIESLRSESATYYANPDGKTVRMELHTQPIRVKNADGKGFTPIDTTLVEADGAIKPKAVKGNLVLSAGQDKTLLKSQAADATAEISTPSALPKPRLKGNTATYPDAYGKGRDLAVIANATGFRQQIIIAERPTDPVSFRVPVDLPKGLSFKKNDAGRPIIVGKGGKTLTEVRPTLLQDAKAADANASMDAGKVGKTAVALGEDGNTLVFTPDAAFLADPAVTYPVTMAAAADDWWETDTSEWHLGGMDTFVNNADYQDSWDNFTLDRILVGKSNSGSVRWRGYLQFPDIPAEFAGSKVENADLILWNYLSNTCGQYVGSGITARQITSDWDETTLHWNTQPSVTNVGADNEPGAYSTDCAGSMNYAWDLIHSVDDIVQAWVDGDPNYGIQLTAGSESDVTNWRRYRSEDAGGCTTAPREACKGQLHPPILTVDFAPKPLRGVVMLEPGEPMPQTTAEIEALKARGRLSETEPSLPALSDEAFQAKFANPVDHNVADSDDLIQAPLPAPVDGVKARWSFAEGEGSTTADSSGNGYQATINEGTRWTPGIADSALTNVGVTSTTAENDETRNPPSAHAIALQQAKARATRVEVANETTATSITYAQPDGKTFRTEITAGPVRTKRGSTWVPIDTQLVEQAGKLRPKALAEGAMVELSAGGTDPFVKMTTDGKSYALRWPTPLPKPTVKGSVATYTDAAGAGADLVVTVLPTGFRHDVVLRHRPSKPLELRIGVEDDGLTLTEGEGGRLLLKDKNKKLVASAPQPLMWPGSAKGLLSLPKSTKVDTDVVKRGGRTELVLKPNPTVLADPATVYPVRVDPAITLPLTADVEVTNDSTEDVPAYPSATNLMAGTISGGVKSRAHLKFDTTELVGRTVTDAKLSMNTLDAPACGTAVGAGIQVRRLTGAWDPNNLYWANMPPSTTEDASTNTKGVNQNCATWPDAMEWNVTGIAQDWAAGASNHGLVLQSPSETNVDNYRVFTSSDDSDFNIPPKLIVTSSGPSSSPTVSALTITPAKTVDGTTVTSSLTPRLAATVTDAIGGNLTGEFEVEHDPTATGQGTGQIWTGSSAAVASGGQATLTIPTGKLTNGWKIRWRARAANPVAGTTSGWSSWQLVTVTVTASAPSVSELVITPSRVVDSVTITSVLTPMLKATVTNPDGNPSRAEFEVEHDPAATGQGTGQIWAGAVDNIASGTQAGIQIPGGQLTDGWKIRWRARAVAGTANSGWAEWQSVTVAVAQPGEKPLATTAGPVIRTDQSFTVGAWVKWNDNLGNYTILEQKGEHNSPFRLGNDPEKGLVFTLASSDSADAVVEGVLSGDNSPINEWFHVAAVYNAAQRTADLYLNGDLIGYPEEDDESDDIDPIATVPISFPGWNSAGPLTLGTRMNGALDEVWIYDRALTHDEIAELFDGSAIERISASRVGTKSDNVMAADPMNYDRVTPQMCWRKFLARNRVGVEYVRNRFSGCTIHELRFAGDGADRGRVYVMLVTNTTNGIEGRDPGKGETSRDMYYDLYFREFTFTDDDFVAADYTLGLKPADGQSACKHITTWNGGTQKNKITKSGEEVRVLGHPLDEDYEKVATFRMRAAPADTSATDRISNCSFNPWVYTDDDDLAEPIKFDWHYDAPPQPVTARCDSAGYINVQFQGGCVLSSVPSLMLKMASGYDAAYKHIWKACYDRADTYPKKASKSIPGCWNFSSNTPPHEKQYLHRAQSTATAVANRGRATTRCKSLWPSYGRNGQDCDEYPWAATKERTRDSDKERNLSVCAMRGSETGPNQIAGKIFTRFLNRERVLRSADPFFMRFNTQLTSVESMDQVCWKPAVGKYTNEP
ncbi:DNRLRE domain-containing protein [Nonomuraea sp. NPDC050691]|uniref:DNRLRE domain-containing protein n=1 Tax=Nonomuraea sp. NPDC050691 TaxID=3155661 RepID=UPI0033F73BA9